MQQILNIQQVCQPKCFGAASKDDAKVFRGDMNASFFLAKQGGSFWKKAKVVRK